eukprot:TRINITY_DN38912_c0_g1_i1.p1 TRINITY_DN38912_c0_g1~~TRINITY_DN38912_c0_g1_i1.p1  ORF type:complete len:345 (+),score=137.39 TRINITY_DN38912_c0_g1_i1:141-1037(+)
MSCYKGVAAVTTIKPEGFRKSAYVEILKKALKVQDSSGEQFSYEVSEGKKDTMRFSVLFKVQDGNIFVKGAEFILKLSVDKSLAFSEFLRRLAILSGEAAASSAEAKTLRQERDRFRTLADEAAKQRLKSEESILEGVVCVINEKKKKLRELVGEVEAAEKEMELMNETLKTKDRKIEKLTKEVERLKADTSKLRTQLNAALMAEPVKDIKRTPSAKRPLDDSADSYPDFTTITAAMASPDPKKQLFTSPVRQLARLSSDVSRTSVGSRASAKRPKRAVTPDTTDPNAITALDLLDSD